MSITQFAGWPGDKRATALRQVSPSGSLSKTQEAGHVFTAFSLIHVDVYHLHRMKITADVPTTQLNSTELNSTQLNFIYKAL